MDVLTIVMSAIGIIISCIALFRVMYKEKKKESPFFILSSFRYTYEGDSYPTDVYPDPESMRFFLAKRNYVKDDSDELLGPDLSLIVNACKKNSMKPARCLVNLNRCILLNVGFDSIYFRLDDIGICYSDNNGKRKFIRIRPQIHNEVFERCRPSEDIHINLSFLLNDDVRIVDLNLLRKPESVNKSLSLTKGELLGTIHPQKADLWHHINIYITSQNTYGKKYKQVITIHSAHETYTARSRRGSGFF